MWSVQNEAVALSRHLVPPATMHQKLATEMKFEEELVQQRYDVVDVVQYLHGNRDLYLGGVNVQLSHTTQTTINTHHNIQHVYCS